MGPWKKIKTISSENLPTIYEGIRQTYTEFGKKNVKWFHALF